VTNTLPSGSAEGFMAQADRALVSAGLLLEAGDTNGACNRAYYAMFDAARAALVAIGAPVSARVAKTHSGLIMAFGLHLVKTGSVDAKIGKLMSRALDTRLTADYDGDSIGGDQANQLIADARVFVATIRALLDTLPESPLAPNRL